MSKTTRRICKIVAVAAFTAGSVAAVPATFAGETPVNQGDMTVSFTQHPNGEVGTEVITPEIPPVTSGGRQASGRAISQKNIETKVPGTFAEAPTPRKADASTAEKPKSDTSEIEEGPKAEETSDLEAPAPTASETPKTEKMPKTEQASPEVGQARPAIVIEEADFPADAKVNTINVFATGFQGVKVGPRVQVSIYALNEKRQITDDPIASLSIAAHQIVDGSFKATFNVPAAQLSDGASYALVAVSNPQERGKDKLVALSSFVVTESNIPAPDVPRPDETPSPLEPPVFDVPRPDETPSPLEPPAFDVPRPDETPSPLESPAPDDTLAPENAIINTEDASLDPNQEYNEVTLTASGFTHDSVAAGVQVAIYRLDSSGNITGEALATHDVPASSIMEGTFTTEMSVLSDRLLPGYVYAIVATSDPNGMVHQVAVTTASISDENTPAPALPAATEDDNTTVRDNGDGTTSVFSAEMRKDGSVVVTESRVPSAQAPKVKVGNTPVSATTLQSGQTVSTQGSTTPSHNRGSAEASSSETVSKSRLAHTGAENIMGPAGLGAAALIAGLALTVLRRRKP